MSLDAPATSPTRQREGTFGVDSHSPVLESHSFTSSAFRAGTSDPGSEEDWDAELRETEALGSDAPAKVARLSSSRPSPPHRRSSPTIPRVWSNQTIRGPTGPQRRAFVADSSTSPPTDSADGSMSQASGFAISSEEVKHKQNPPQLPLRAAVVAADQQGPALPRLSTPPTPPRRAGSSLPRNIDLLSSTASTHELPTAARPALHERRRSGIERLFAPSLESISIQPPPAEKSTSRKAKRQSWNPFKTQAATEEEPARRLSSDHRHAYRASISVLPSAASIQSPPALRTDGSAMSLAAENDVSIRETSPSRKERNGPALSFSIHRNLQRAASQRSWLRLNHAHSASTSSLVSISGASTVETKVASLPSRIGARESVSGGNSPTSDECFDKLGPSARDSLDKTWRMPRSVKPSTEADSNTVPKRPSSSAAVLQSTQTTQNGDRIRAVPTPPPKSPLRGNGGHKAEHSSGQSSTSSSERPKLGTKSQSEAFLRRNSMGDLRIPKRISQAQQGIRANMTFVRDFAAGVNGKYKLGSRSLTRG